MKIPQSAIAEFEFYKNSNLDMIGNLVGVSDPRANPNGKTALECWFLRDTHGKTEPCREIEMLQKVERSKQSLNLQVKLWAEDIANPVGLLLTREELAGYCKKLPPWVFRATMQQAGKLLMDRIGFIPSFAKP